MEQHDPAKPTAHWMIACASRSLGPAEKNYSTIERESLAIWYFIHHFHHYLLGRPFIVYTDHAPLRYWQADKEMLGRRGRWLANLQEYQFEIKYLEGKNNQVADILSRSDEHCAPPEDTKISSGDESFKEGRGHGMETEIEVDWADPTSLENLENAYTKDCQNEASHLLAEKNTRHAHWKKDIVLTDTRKVATRVENQSVRNAEILKRRRWQGDTRPVAKLENGALVTGILCALLGFTVLFDKRHCIMFY